MKINDKIRTRFNEGVGIRNLMREYALSFDEIINIIKHETKIQTRTDSKVSNKRGQ